MTTLNVPPQASSFVPSLANRRQLALERVQGLITTADLRATRASRNYYGAQILAIALAAITPCLIFLAKDNPRNEVVNWLQLFFPALAAVAAGVTHLFRWREESVRNTQLAEAIRSELWHYQTRAGDISTALSEDQALDKLVTSVDQLNLRSVTQWSTAQLAEATAPTPSKAPDQPASPASPSPTPAAADA